MGARARGEETDEGVEARVSSRVRGPNVTTLDWGTTSGGECP